VVCIVAVLAAACAAGPGPWVAEMEAAHPVMTNVETLETGERVRVSRNDANGPSLANGQPGRSASHSQVFMPGGAATLADVEEELRNLAVANGWTERMYLPTSQLRCLDREVAVDGVTRTDRLRLRIGRSTAEIGDAVTISFRNGRC